MQAFRQPFQFGFRSLRNANHHHPLRSSININLNPVGGRLIFADAGKKFGG